MISPESKNTTYSGSSMSTERFFDYIDRAQLGYAKSVVYQKDFDVNRKNRLGYTPLIHVTIHNFKDMVTQLMEQGADLNIQDLSGDTALMIAARRGSFEIVKLLVEKGADIHLVNDRGSNALMLAIEGQGGNSNKQNNSYHNIIEYLLNKCSQSRCLAKDLKYCNKNGDDLLTIAVRNGCIEVVKLILEKGVDINGCNINGDTALIIAVSIEEGAKNKRSELVSDNKIEILRILLSKEDLDVNKENPCNGFTPLMVVARSGNLAAAKMLFSTGRCDVNKLDKSGKGALYSAVHRRDFAMTKFLIENGAKIQNCIGIGPYRRDYIPLGATNQLARLLHETYKSHKSQKEDGECSPSLSQVTITDGCRSKIFKHN